MRTRSPAAPQEEAAKFKGNKVGKRISHRKKYITVDPTQFVLFRHSSPELGSPELGDTCKGLHARGRAARGGQSSPQNTLKSIENPNSKLFGEQTKWTYFIFKEQRG